jgi:hypothetical protein
MKFFGYTGSDDALADTKVTSIAQINAQSLSFIVMGNCSLFVPPRLSTAQIDNKTVLRQKVARLVFGVLPIVRQPWQQSEIV